MRQLQRREGLDLGIGRHARLIAVALELAAHQILRRQRPQRLEDLHLLIAQRLAAAVHRRLHGQERHHLQQVILDHVANRAGLLVELAAPLDAEVLGHRDLDAGDVVAVPDRLEERVREAEIQQVLHRLLAQVMVDAEDRALVENLDAASDSARGRWRDPGRRASRSPRARPCRNPRRPVA